MILKVLLDNTDLIYEEVVWICTNSRDINKYNCVDFVADVYPYISGVDNNINAGDENPFLLYDVTYN